MGGKSVGGAAVRVVIVQAESREMGGHVLFRKELPKGSCFSSRFCLVVMGTAPPIGELTYWAQGPTWGPCSRGCCRIIENNINCYRKNDLKVV